MDPPPPPPVHHRNGNVYPSSAYPPAATAPLLPSVKTKEPDPFADFSTSCIDNGKIYSLQIAQQPVRARMCGFGDKDRRPITPPPCIRLIVRDATSNEEIDINEIDTSFFVLTVDLWSAEGKREVNLVRHSATSPSISAATSSSYPPPVSGPMPLPYQSSAYHPPPPPPQQMPMVAGYPPNPMMMHQPMHNPNAYQQSYPQYPSQAYAQQPYQQAHLPPPPLSSQQPGYYQAPTSAPVTPTHFYPPSAMQQTSGPLLSPREFPAPVMDPRSSPTGMFTRNLIGSLCVSAFKLTSPENDMGVWFILQDLSVRTEGNFRLKMNFVNVGSPTSSQSLNNGTAPVLASVFSEPFTVYSAKKFPGVIESTDLSKCFALQGIKIPIRKDGTRQNVREKDENDDDDS